MRRYAGTMVGHSKDGPRFVTRVLAADRQRNLALLHRGLESPPEISFPDHRTATEMRVPLPNGHIE